MKVLRFFVLSFLSVALWSCCSNNDIKPDQVDRTVLIYMAADNNLSSFARRNIVEMKAGMTGRKGNLVVYIDLPNELPRLIKINEDGTETVIRTYEEENSASAQVLKRSLKEAFEAYPAESYGLVLWSHGTGWLPPGGMTSYSLLRTDDPLYRDPDAIPMTKTFGADGSNQMAIADLGAALPQNRQLDFLLFDACFMGGIETLYELRNASKSIIASPTEVMGSGFPYDKVIPQMFTSTLSLPAICRSFVEYYQLSTYPSASIGLVKTAQLDALALTVKEIFTHHPNQVANLLAVQSLEKAYTHIFFDMADYLQQVTGGDAYYEAFVRQLNNTVEYESHTSRIYSDFGSKGFFDLRTSCGINIFAPQTKPSLLPVYKETAWAKAVGL